MVGRGGVVPGTNMLENSGIYINELNPFVFNTLKKDCLENVDDIQKQLKDRTGDLLQMFKIDAPKEMYFKQPTKSRDGLTRELLQICNELMEEYPEYLTKIGYYMEENSLVDLYVERYWINYQLPGEFVPLHQHSGVFSFVVWVSLPDIQVKKNIPYNGMKGYQGDFEFTYPDILGSLRSIRLAQDKSWEGKICVFPAGLHHQVYPHFEDDIRITVSGNIRAKLTEVKNT